MRSDHLEVRARIRAHVRKLIADLRYYGVDEAVIQDCRTLHQLDALHGRVVAYLITSRDPRRPA